MICCWRAYAHPPPPRPQALFDGGMVKDRKEIFITATLEQSDFHRVSGAIEQTLTNLGTDYVDLLLMNWPDVGCGNDNVEGRSRIWRCVRSNDVYEPVSALA